MLRLQQVMTKDVSLRSFLVAGAIMAVAVAAREALDGVLPGTPPFITLYPAVAITALLCGPWAGAASAALGMVAALFFWMPPQFSFAIPSITDCVAIGLFALSSLAVLWVAAVLRRQFAAATVAKQALDLGLAAGGVGTWEMDLRSRRISASDGAFDLHGLPATKGGTTAEDWLRGVPPEDAAGARAALHAAIEGGTTAAYTYRVLGGPDGPRWIAARGRTVSAGSEQRLLCALVDVTDQVRVQDELKRERERLRLALQAAALAVWDYSPETGEATVDPQYAVTMGFDPKLKTLTRAQIGERMHPEDRPRVIAEHEASVANGSTYHIEYRIITPAGETRWLSSQGIQVKDELGYDRGRLIGIIQDITERKRREETLRDLAAMRELLVREADHRIKNSLQLVVSLLTVQMRGVTDPAAADALRGAIARVGAIAASHLALQGSEDLRTLDLGVTLRELCAHFAQLHPAITVICRPEEALVLDADRAIPLALAVSEVLTNALRHAFRDRASGAVVVEAMRQQSQLVVRVSDDGAGMDAETEGTGLGSRIILSLATRLAATIRVDSTPDAGTVVTLRLPLWQAEPAERARA
jgi:two-component sensor histidine kinase/PAS domain-containing protein